MTRTKTAEPLVEQDSEGGLYPTGRVFSDQPRTDDRNSYGLTDAENVAFVFARERLAHNADTHGTPAADFVTIEEATYLRDSGQGAGFDGDKDAAIAHFREAHPLPTSFSELHAGDPSLYVDPAAAPAVDAAPAAPAVIEQPAVVLTAIPEDHAPVDVPDDIAAKLPADAAVSMAPSGALAASVTKDGAVHHIFAEIGHGFHELVAKVEAFFGHAFGG
jgi:hypothetical protein